jgi:alginate O-acetyltransferase complex protein AlgI
MLFNSFTFLILFLPLVLAISIRLKGQTLLRWIALASFVFYAFAGHVWFIVPMLITTCLDFFMASLIAGAQSAWRKKSFLIFSITCNLGMLFYFKYSGLMLHTAQWAVHFLGYAGHDWALGALAVVLPAGISFYTFQTLSYIIDVYRGNVAPEKNFWRFACFVSFFPHLVAGPLTRHDQLIPQLTRISTTGIRPLWEHGMYLFAIGLCKKVLFGDRIATLIHPLINSTEHMTMAAAWLALIGFTLQIYFDFSGYSDMAIGLGRLFGIELPQNFNSPYKAKNPSDFWRRWHITLSLWLRDYLYISLGGNRCSPVRRNINVMLTMIIGGLWHGASWTFAVWGCYHGVLLVLFYCFEKPWSRLPAMFQRTATFLLIMIGWLFFKAVSWAQALDWLSRLVDFSSPMPALSEIEIKLALMALLGIIITQAFPNASSNPDLAKLHPAQKFILGIVTLGAVVMLNYSSRFLYFQF